jgi:hypothetical protein
MKKLRLKEWAAIAEIIGTIAVIISLIFVATSINRNTAVMQASNDNFVYELQYARIREVVASPEMAAIYVKFNQQEELTAVEEERFYWDTLQELGTWEIAFNRHRDGMFSSEQWQGWDRFLSTVVPNRLSVESWTEIKEWYAEDFRYHVDSVYANQ